MSTNLRPALFVLAAAAFGCAGAPPPPPEELPAEPPSAPPAEGAPAAAAVTAAKSTPREDPNLIPRAVLFGNPDRSGATISPDGKQIAFLAPEGGVLNVWVAPASDPGAAKAVTHEKVRGLRAYFWSYSSQQIVYLQDKGGDENFRAYVVDLAKNETKDLTPMDGVQTRIQEVSPRIPGEILLSINKRDPKHHDLYRADLKTGKLTPVVENKDGFIAYVTDDDYKPRLALRTTPDGGQEILKPDPKAKDAWVSYLKIPAEDSLTTGPVEFDKTGKVLYMNDSRGRDTAALFAVDLASGKQTLLAEDPKADMTGTLIHPTEKRVQAAASTRERTRWQVLDKSIQPDFDALAKVAPGDFRVTSRSLDDKTWIVFYELDDGPGRFYRYDRASKKADFLFTNRKALEGAPLAKMRPVTIKSRDGMDLVSYLSLPKASDPDGDGKPDKQLPVVLLVHGGPWGRDGWGLNPAHQWLSNRGYGVLSVNFRGSTGLGKKFTNAGDKEWAGKMHDDLIDAVKWAVDAKIADPAKVAIQGGSYGGYSTLVGLTFTPDTFACGVDIVGPSNLVTLLSTIPPYWAPMLNMFAQRVGDPRTDDGKKLLLERSPLGRVASIKKPLLIGQGANDPRVKQSEADQIVKAMQERKIPVTYVLYSDEGHGFARPENRMSFNAVNEIFLAQCLGGAYQPVGADFKGSTIAVPAGAEQIHSLPEAISKK
jgi:dipeptidyl aminopeptidase/acylaminoacyl peptidase